MYSTDEVLDVVKSVVKIFTTKISSPEDMKQIESELPFDLKDQILATIAAGMMMHMMRSVANGDVVIQDRRRNLFSEN